LRSREKALTAADATDDTVAVDVRDPECLSSSPRTSFRDSARGEANGGVSPEELCESKTLCETEEEPAPEAAAAEAARDQLDPPPKWLAKVVSLKSQKRGRRRCPPALPARARSEFMVSGRSGGIIYLS
jgi:hypothetical protein